MEEQLQAAISALIYKSLEMFEKGATFLSGEIPDVIQQLLQWKFTMSIINDATCVLVFLGTIFWLIYQYKYWTQTEKYRGYDGKQYARTRIEGDAGALSLLNLVCLVPLIISFVNINLTWLQIWLAPKIYLIEYAATLIKK